MRILIIGMPKSGTTMLTYKISASCDAGVLFEPDIECKKREEAQHSNRNIVAKLVYNKVITNIINKFEDYDKKILITRDPRDIIISLFFYNLHHEIVSGWKLFPKSALDKVLQIIKKKEKDASIPLHEVLICGNHPCSTLKSLLNFYKNSFVNFVEFLKGSSEYHIIKYENIIDAKIQDLESHLGFSLTTEFEVDKKLNRVTRSKTYGAWRDWFTAEDVELFKPYLEESIVNLGYDLDWDINNNTTIDPEFGSGYILNSYIPS